MACAPLITQSPNEGLSPVNAVSVDDDKHLFLFGHDVVSYFQEDTHKLGKASIKSTYKDVTFWFSSHEHKVLFYKEPSKYIPQFGGYCANGIAYGIPWGGNADTWKIIDNKLYIFGGQSSQDAFLVNSKENISLAHEYWENEVKDSNAFFQRSWRLAWRVPHYKTGKELAELVEKSKN